MATERDKFEVNLLRLIKDNTLQIISVEYYLKREGVENRKPFSKDKFLNMLRSSSFPFEGGLSYFFPPIKEKNQLRIDGGFADPYYEKNIVVWLQIQDGYTCEDIENELNAAIVIDLDKMRAKKQKYMVDGYLTVH